MSGLHHAEVLLPFHTANALRKPFTMSSVGIRSIEGPVKNGPIYRRYGVFPYCVAFNEESYAALMNAEFPLGQAVGDLLTESERLGFQLLVKLHAPDVLTGAIQLIGYKHERQKAGTERKDVLRKLYDELRSHRGSALSAIFPGLGNSTVH